MVFDAPKGFFIKDAEKKLVDVWDYVQTGLVYSSPHAIFVSFRLRDNAAQIICEDLAILMNKISSFIMRNIAGVKNHTSAILGVDIELAKKVFKDPKIGGNNTAQTIEKTKGIYSSSGAHLWFHIKSDNKEDCRKVCDFIRNELAGYLDITLGADDLFKDGVFERVAESKSTQPDGQNGKVLGNRFSENLNNPSDPISISKHILVGAENFRHLGASYVLSQSFNINWEQLHQMGEAGIEKIIGRKTDDTILPSKDTKSHIKTSRIQDEAGNTTPVLRLGLPFGRYQRKDPRLIAQGANAADEEGIYFAGFSKDIQVLQRIINNQMNGGNEFTSDRLFETVKSTFGGFFYIPSIFDLGLHDTNKYDFYHRLGKWEGKEKNDWSNFPQVDWHRLDRHFKQDPDVPNPYMFYNHQHYLWRMATVSAEDKKRLEPPSVRILSLLENTFSRWQDGWYIDRKQQEMGHIKDYLEGKFPLYPDLATDLPANIMQQSIMIRKAWATRLSLRLVTHENYGFRGVKLQKENRLTPYFGNSYPKEGELVTGADTFRIQVDEIIVGGMPNLSLGQGRYVMQYLSDDERLAAYTKNLSEASGVGHVVPGYEKLLEHGISGIKDDVKKKLYDIEKKCNKVNPSPTHIKMREFYSACLITLDGITDYCQRYANLAQKMAVALPDRAIFRKEKANLLMIAERMSQLGYHKPKHFVDGVQLIFIVHCCLHLTGEPIAIGRFDQLLIRLYQKDIRTNHITQAQAQEIIDAFFIKLDEKVQLNRLNVEDHQPYGNLAMGGASTPYPQGGAMNQWVQQLTVGGTISDNTPYSSSNKGQAAYNQLTLLCIKSIRRLPLNAPCLSLRVRSDISDTKLGRKIMKEAAKAILSGGAHPIFLNDDLLIPGLQNSGKNIGGASFSPPGWDSTVSWKSAKNYACDGCYEPQFPGENWFSLGGFTTLKPLECALNGGKTYVSAGPGYLRGQKESPIDTPVESITTFEALKKLYFLHFKALYIKSCLLQLAVFGANTAICPSPLLSLFIDNCIDKGRDLYDGGARYHIYAPCFVGLSSMINSLFAIEKMVFDEKLAVTTLPELRDCLMCDWGYNMIAPCIDPLSGEEEIVAKANRFKILREIALSLPRYGRGDKTVDEFGNRLIQEIVEIAVNTFKEPSELIAKELTRLASEYGAEGTSQHFGIQIQPGVGTFENHVEMGQWSGASADGRRASDTIASDLSPTPYPSDLLPIDYQEASFSKALAGFTPIGTAGMTDGAPTDFNIPENFSEQELRAILNEFARGSGSNILTITVASPETFVHAIRDPERYNLLRVRTGGWTEFFIALFSDKQNQHQCRPLSLSSATSAPYFTRHSFTTTHTRRIPSTNSFISDPTNTGNHNQLSGSVIALQKIRQKFL